MLLTRYAPLRRSPPSGIATQSAAPRLACVKPAASVHPEPGSNSSLYIKNIKFQLDPQDLFYSFKETNACSFDFNRVKIGTCLYFVLPIFQWTSTTEKIPLTTPFPKRVAKVNTFFNPAKKTLQILKNLFFAAFRPVDSSPSCEKRAQRWGPFFEFPNFCRTFFQ